MGAGQVCEHQASRLGGPGVLGFDTNASTGVPAGRTDVVAIGLCAHLVSMRRESPIGAPRRPFKLQS